MLSGKARITGWMMGAGALLIGSNAGGSDSFTAQMDAVVRIGSEQIDLRAHDGLLRIEDARAHAVEILLVAEAIGVDDDTLRLAEFDAKNSVREAAKHAHADLRGMVINTVTTLENFAATPDQISLVLDRWDAHADTLEDAVEGAFDSVEDATPGDTTIASKRVVPVSPTHGMQDEAERVLEGLAFEMEADLRAQTDEIVRGLRFEKTRSHAKRVERRMFAEAQRAAQREGKAMLKAVKEQFKAYRSAGRTIGMTSSESRAIKASYQDAMTIIRNAMDDAKADIRAAR